MRNLYDDLKQLNKDQDRFDLTDDYLLEHGNRTRLEFNDRLGYEFSYGITFVESWIAEEWLKRAIEAENELLKFKKGK